MPKKKRQQSEHVYKPPRTAAELQIVCAECGEQATWFDPLRARKDHLQGFVCDLETRSTKSEKLLVREKGSDEGSPDKRRELAEVSQ